MKKFYIFISCLAWTFVSGSAIASPEDLDVTHRLKVAGDILGVEVLDHVLLAGGKWYSFAEHENL